MPLQTSGPISMGDIATEFGLVLPQSMSQLATAAGLSLPVSLTDFYGLAAGLPDIDWAALTFNRALSLPLSSMVSMNTSDGRFVYVTNTGGTVECYDLITPWTFNNFTPANQTGGQGAFGTSAGGSIVSNPAGTILHTTAASTLDITKRTLGIPNDPSTASLGTTITTINDKYNSTNGTVSPVLPANSGSYGTTWGDNGNTYTFLYRGANTSIQAYIVTIDCSASPYEVPNTSPNSACKIFQVPAAHVISSNLSVGAAWSRTGRFFYFGNFTDNRITRLEFSTPYDINTFVAGSFITNFTSSTANSTNFDFIVNQVADEIWTLNFNQISNGLNVYS